MWGSSSLSYSHVCVLSVLVYVSVFVWLCVSVSLCMGNCMMGVVEWEVLALSVHLILPLFFMGVHVVPFAFPVLPVSGCE